MDINTSLASHFSFDLWLTLIKSHPDFKPKRNIVFRDFFSINKSIEDITIVLRKYDVLANLICETTGIHFDGSHIYSLALNELGVNLEGVSNERFNDFEREVDSLFLKFKPMLLVPNIFEIFNDIKNNSKTISITSNTAFIKGKILRKILDDYGLSEYILFQIYSDEVGFAKPHRGIFDLVFQRLIDFTEISKEKILHIGDNRIADYEGAINYGFKAILI